MEQMLLEIQALRAWGIHDDGSTEAGMFGKAEMASNMVFILPVEKTSQPALPFEHKPWTKIGHSKETPSCGKEVPVVLGQHLARLQVLEFSPLWRYTPPSWKVSCRDVWAKMQRSQYATK